MDAEYAYHYTREVMIILIREFQSPDEEMKKIVLKVSCCCWNFLKFNFFISYFIDKFLYSKHSVFKYILLLLLSLNGYKYNTL